MDLILASATRSKPRTGFAGRGIIGLAIGIFCLALAVRSGAIAYLSADEFIASSFVNQPVPAVVWLTPELQESAKKILGHPYRGLRLRYWREGQKSAWIMDEIGKERPITIGIVIDDHKLARVAVLEYRETRGDEVRHAFFTQQFQGVGLDEKLNLSTPIDGISGATLSVRAVTNISRFALYLDQSVVATQ